MNSNFHLTPEHPLKTLATLVIIIAGMKLAAPLLNPLFLSIFIAIMCWPVLSWLSQKGVASWISITLIIIALVVILLGLGVYVASAAHQFSREIITYQHNLHTQISGVISWLHARDINLPNEQEIIKEIDAGKIMRFFGGLLSGLGNVFANIFFIVLTVVFILLESFALPQKLGYAFDDPTVINRFNSILLSVKQYLMIKVITSLVTGLSITLWLIYLDVDFPVLWGVVAFMLNFVPNIGSIIAAIPTVLLTLVQLNGMSALLVAFGYIVVNTVIGNIWEPRIMGKGLGLSTLVVFLSLTFWGWVFGTVGMLLSVPFTMIAKIIMENNEKTRWIAILLGSENDLKVVEELSVLESDTV